MPTKVSERWIADGNAVKSDLEKDGYKVDLEYANNDIPTQVQQINTMITKGAKVLIIASIDGSSLTDQLDAAAKAGIKVISYDRLITGDKNVDYYVSFDNYKVGVYQANSLLTGLGVLDADGKATGKKGPFNVELFAGCPDDNNATFFFNGAMDTLKPYLDNGTLVVKSGQTDFKQVAILRWDPATAKTRMEDLVAKSYSGGATVQGVLSPYDGLSDGILTALQGAGYGSGGKNLPVITGQDAEVASVKQIIAGTQYSTIFKDTRQLANAGRQDGQRRPHGQEARGQRHQELRQQGQGRPGLPAPAGRRHEGQLPEGPGRQRLLQGIRPASSPTRGPDGPWRTPSAPPHPPGPSTQTRRLTMANTILEMRDITKTFPGVKALQDVSIAVERGDGPRHLRRERRRQVDPDEGALRRLPARHLRRRDPLRRRAGASSSRSTTPRPRASSSSTRSSRCRPYLSIAENIFLGNERPARRPHRLERDQPRGGASCSPASACATTRSPRSQTSASASSSSSRSPRRSPRRCKLLILDEPTAALNDDDSAHLLDLIRQLQEQGIT